MLISVSTCFQFQDTMYLEKGADCALLKFPCLCLGHLYLILF